MEFYWGYANPNFLPKICSKEVWERSPQKWSKNCINSPRNRETAQGPDKALPCRDARPPVHRRTGGCAPMHGRACDAQVAVHQSTVVRLVARLDMSLPGVHGRAPLWHDRALSCFPLLCYSWCLGLPRTSSLPWNHSWSLLFYRNLMISSEMKNERILGTIRSKGR